MVFCVFKMQKDNNKYAALGIVLYFFGKSKAAAFGNECLLPFIRAYISGKGLA